MRGVKKLAYWIGIAAAVLGAIVLAVFRPRKVVPGERGRAEQVASRLADGKAGVEHIAIVEHESLQRERETARADRESVTAVGAGIKAQAGGLAKQAESIGRAEAAVDDGLRVLEEIAERN